MGYSPRDVGALRHVLLSGNSQNQTASIGINLFVYLFLFVQTSLKGSPVSKVTLSFQNSDMVVTGHSVTDSARARAAKKTIRKEAQQR